MQTVTAYGAEASTEASGKKPAIAPLAIAIAALVLAAVPYIWGYAHAPRGMRFLGQIFVIDDYCVYLSWTKQAIDGHFFVRNLFTTAPQHGIEFNLFFLMLGQIARLSHMSVDIILQLARLIAAAGLLWAVYQLYAFCLPGDHRARTAAFAIAALGSGVAWLHYLKDRNLSLVYPSADSAQPEAFTFTSAYFAPLMSVGTMLICGSLGLLLKAVLAGKKRYAIAAGVLLLILGNVHSYDVIHVAFAWITFLIAFCATNRRFDRQAVGLSVMAGVIALPSVLYQVYVLRHERVFYQRAMEAATLTPDISFYIMGYGLVLLLAVLGARELLRQKPIDPKLLMIVCWAVAGIACPYLVKLPFQRKLIMGADIPLSLLAGIGTMAAARLSRPQLQKAIAVVIVLTTIPSTLLFIGRDLSTLSKATEIAGSTPSPYFTQGESDTLSWLASNTRPGDAVLAPMRLSLFVPGYCDRFVWAAHWGETPHCEDKLRQFSTAWTDGAADTDRRALLRDSRARYFCYPNNPNHASLNELTPAHAGRRRYADIADNPPTYLRPVYRNSEYTVFSVSIP